MLFLKRLFAPKEVKAALGVVEECELTFSSEGLHGDCFKIVKSELVPYILKSSQILKDHLSNGFTIRGCVLAAIVTIAQNHVTSGRYHTYRGVMSPIGPGPALRQICEKAIDSLVQEGSVTKDDSEQWKKDIREQISNVG